MSTLRAISVLLVLASGVVAPVTNAGAEPAPASSAPADLGVRVDDPAEDGLVFVGATTFSTDLGRRVVSVTSELELTNVKPDEPTTDGVLQYRFPGVVVPVLDAAADLRAVSAGTVLDVSVASVDGITDAAEITFPTALRFGEERSVTLSYAVPSAPARSRGDVTRVNDAYVAVPVFAVGDPGLASVTVELPAGSEPETVGSDPTFGDDPVEVGGVTRVAAANIADPSDWWAIVTAQNDAALVDTEVNGDGRSFVVRAWPGDTEWAAFVTRYLGAPLDRLSALIDEPWPDPEPFSVVEAYSPYLYGYGGWFEPRDRRIVIGEDLEPSVVMHELSHAWFNGGIIEDRWIAEGLANTFGALTLTAIGEPAPGPGSLADQPEFFLIDWEDALSNTDQPDAAALEAYGYAASWQLISAVTEEIGLEAMQSVLEAAFRRTSAYPGPGPRSVSAGRVDSRRFLDLVERIGGSTSAGDLLGRYVFDPATRATLDDRAAALTELDRIEAASTGWAVPFGVREAMARWDFAAATRGMEQTRDLLDRKASLEQAASDAALSLPADLRKTYETARLPLRDAALRIDHLTEAAGETARVVALVDDDRGVVAGIGLWGRDLEADLAEIRADFAAGDLDAVSSGIEDLEKTLDHAGRNGALRLGAAVGAAGLLMLTVPVVRRRRRSRREVRFAPAGPEPSDHHRGGTR